MQTPFTDDNSNVPAAGLVPIENLVGEDEDDTRILREAANHAEQYLRSFAWCANVIRAFFGGGVGGVFTVFLFNIRPAPADVSPWIWVVVGDIPPAYLPIEDCESPAEVFRTYIQGMNNWIVWVRQGQTGVDEARIPPVNVPPTPEWAEKLDQRLHSLQLIVKPFFEETGESERVN